LRDALDRVHLARELGEDRGGVTRSGPDVENALVAGEPERLAGQRDHVGLRDRLAEQELDRGVVVGGVPQLGRREELPRDPGHRREDALVADAALEELAIDPAGNHGYAAATSALTTPKWASRSPLMPVIEAGGSPSPTVSIGTTESSSAS